MKEYSSYLTFDNLSESQLSEISSLTDEYNFEVDFDHKFLEFNYSGRDTSLNVIKYFYKLATIVQNASGELVSEIVNDDGDNEFEFYKIKNGKLFFQSGKIIRGEEELIEID
ncbi:hypothetical protein H0A36_14555 [Endozoicomonas sp. SM1973]|uniref:Uncharacterized protein n=1 Tax=Spartinivicinus marinus TaxID=2994442 RepID=A0A853II07_9GAMM|nr:hypothetical protein [Spartinivicinus marinus]MCX4028569.1 hypothetical protein [Spartinivicinus marinus]NYZ67236.1 hypothetical protein [Spartinivicinus marinus]